jgi:hypothetical protein
MFDGIGVNVSATVREVSAGCSWKKRSTVSANASNFIMDAAKKRKTRRSP